MKKSTIGIFVGIGISILAITFIPGLVKYLVPPIDTPSAEPVYHRVEAEKYEIVFPMYVNGLNTYGSFSRAGTQVADVRLFGSIQFSDEDCLLPGNSFQLGFKVYCDGSSMEQSTSLYNVVQGEYGRYLISETQVADEPVVYTLEPIYEYVLVE
jgi:hypothetical protein